MGKVALLLLAHVVLILLAATNFTIIDLLWQSEYNFQVNYYEFLSYSRWSRSSVPQLFSLLQVATYILGYAVGLVGYWKLRRYRQRLIVGAGLLLCSSGLASFLFELTNWPTRTDHRSLIVSIPAAAVVVAAAGIFQLIRGMARQAPQGYAPQA